MFSQHFTDETPYVQMDWLGFQIIQACKGLLAAFFLKINSQAEMHNVTGCGKVVPDMMVYEAISPITLL